MTLQIEAIRERLAREPIHRSVSIVREGVDETARTIRLAFASDVPVDHWMGPLILTTKKKAVRTERMDLGLALLEDHDRCEHIGIVENFSFDADGLMRGDARFSRSEDGEEVFQDVLDGIKRFVSVGFMIYELHVDNEKDGVITYRCDDWEPFEISIVSVPADISVGVGRSMEKAKQVLEPLSPDSRAITTTENTMTPEEIAAQAAANEQRAATAAALAAPSATAELVTRTREIVEFAEIFGEVELARTMIASSPSVTVDDVRVAIRAKQTATPATPAPLAPADQAAREGGVVRLARTLPRYGTLRNFIGPDAAERAHRFGQWILAMRGISAGMSGEGAFARSMNFCRDNGIVVTRAMSEGVNESGGFLVPEEFGNDLIDLREIYGVFRRNAKIVPMASDSRSDPRRTGGLTAYFANEGDAITASDKGWDRVNLAAEKLTCLARYSNEVNEDAVINMGDDLAGEIAYAFAVKEDACGFIGDGTDTYGGMQGVTTKLKGLNGTIANIAGLTVATGTGYATNYASIVLTDFEAVAGNLPVYADTARAKWYCHKSFYWNVMVKLALAAGGNAGSNIENGSAKKFLGYDVEFVQIMPKTSAVSQVCALLGDLSLAASFGSRRDTTIAVSEHSRFANDQLEIRGTERFDINVHDVGNWSATAASRVSGPIVGLITAAS